MSGIRVVIADDQPMMRAGFKAVLEATGDIHVVAEASTGEEAVAAASQHAPDVVLMDIRMPGMDGIEATRRLPRQRVLILTTFGLDEYIISALRAGASGFLLKDAPTQEVLAAVRAVAARGARRRRALCPDNAPTARSGRTPAAGGGLAIVRRDRDPHRARAAGAENARIRLVQRRDRTST